MQGSGFGGEGDIRLSFVSQVVEFETEDLLPFHGGWCGDTELSDVRRPSWSEAR